MNTLEPVRSSKILLVEGQDELHFFKEIMKRESLDIQVEDYKGKDNLKKFLIGLQSRTGHDKMKSLGIVRDADSDPAAAYDSICSALQTANYPEPDRKGVDENILKVNILIIPDRDTPGMLEDICLESIKEDPIIECVDEYFNCIKLKIDKITVEQIKQAKTRTRSFLVSREIIESSVYEKFQETIKKLGWPKSHSSAKIHAFLASMPKPYLELGTAAEAGYFDFNHPVFQNIINFLKQL